MPVEMEQTVTPLTQKHLALTLTMLGLTATMRSTASFKRSVKLQALVISVALPLQLTLIQVSLTSSLQCTFEELLLLVLVIVRIHLVLWSQKVEGFMCFVTM